MAGRVSSPVFVGRHSEIEGLARALDGALDGKAVHRLIAGEAGVGKTRLTAEVERLARQRGFRVLRGGCVNLGSSSLPYGPFIEALRALMSEMDRAEASALAGPGAADLARLVPGFGTVGVGAPLQSEWVDARLFEALLGFLVRLAEREPVLMIVEDLHWADPASREAMAFLVRALQHARVLFVATYRSDELHRRHPLLPWLAELDRGGRVERLQLARLDREELAVLVGAILGQEPRADLIDDVFDRSDGNPFFAEELLAAGRDAGSASRLPPTLREVILARIALAPEAAQPVLGVAAVAGRRVAHDLLARVADVAEGPLVEGLRAAIGGHLLVVEDDGGTERYAFRHALVQEVVYEDLLPGERRSLHRAFAEALAAEGPGTGGSQAGYWAELAHHWAAARQDVRAFEASLRAADAAMASFAFVAALEGFEHALELWDGIPGAADIAGHDRVELLRRAGVAAYLGADPRRATAHRREAVNAVDPTVDPVRAGILREELGRALYVNGDATGSLQVYRDAVATIPADPPTPERARAISGLGQILMLRSRFEESRALCDEAIAIARVVGARRQEGHALTTLGLDLVGLGDCEGGVAALEDGLRIAYEVHDAGDVGRAYVNLSDALDQCGLPGRALDVVLEGVRAADELGIGHSYGFYIRAGGVAIAAALGRWDVARRLHEEARSGGPSGSGGEIYLLANTLGLLVGEGRFDVVDTGLARAFRIMTDDSDPQYLGPVHIAAAERELWRGDPRASLDLAERGLERLDDSDDRAYTAVLCRVGAWAAADLGERARAAREQEVVDEARLRLAGLAARMVRASEVSHESGMGRMLAACRATLVAEADRLEGQSLPSTWSDLAQEWTELERPYVVAYARWREAEAALAAGDRAAATVALRSARSVTSDLGAEPLGEALAGLARRARLSLPDGPSTDTAASGDDLDADPFGLTPREREVLTLVADGRTNRQIAEALFISESTAGVHVSNILGKLGVTNRGEAAATAFRLRLVVTDAAPT